MIQDILVFLIVGIAVGWMIRSFYHSIRGKSGCGCSCTHCDASVHCAKEPD